MTRKYIFATLFMLTIVLAGAQLYYSKTKASRSTVPSYGSVPEFSMITESHQPFTKQNLIGKVSIADFIFTTCAGPCPLMSGQMQQFQSEMIRDERLQLISFSVDPVEDTPDVLKEYAGRFSAVQGRWFFLTGQATDMYTLSRTGFHLGVEADSNAILHSTKFVLIDANAVIRGYYDSEDEESLSKLRKDVIVVLEE